MRETKVPATDKGRATRQRILQAAAELVAEKGAAGMSLDDVCERTGASRSQLYHYFADRDDLVRMVSDLTTDVVIDVQGELLGRLDSWTGIGRWFDALVQLQVDRQARGGCPIGSLVGQLAERDPGARAAIAAGLERWETHLRDGLTRMKALGKLRRDASQLRIALDAARANLRLSASSGPRQTRDTR